MPLTPGTRLGPYEIIAPLGAGGMGEVFRATDTRLGRDVAIKVLPQHLSDNAEVRARFEREAKTVSSLNHPHICTLHDVGREGDTDYLVMELVEGETLAQRLAKGALPSADVFRFGEQVADGLDRAHRAGVIHRDLKPGNVMLTRSGAKLMDFGLARATGMSGPAGGSGLTQAALTQSPTVAAPLTAEGTIVGTFQYMSPEQLEGKEADARSDLWALGCVLYEMATGKRAFEGKSQASLIASILERQPEPASASGARTPPELDAVITRCLAKDPDDRWQSARDIVLELRARSGSAPSGTHRATATGGAPRRAPVTMVWTVGVIAALGVFAAGVLLAPRLTGLRPATPPLRLTAEMPQNLTLSLRGGDFSLSPDGKSLLFVARDSLGTSTLWVRPLDGSTPVKLAGTQGAFMPFWSPDSRSVGFFAGDKLRKVSVLGGTPQDICTAASGRGGTWGRDGVILFAPGAEGPLYRVSAQGGVPVAATALDTARHELGHRFPRFLPDGRHFLFATTPTVEKEHEIYLAEVGSPSRRFVLRCDGTPDFTHEGWLLFHRSGLLFAQRFDPGSARLSGQPEPMFPASQGDGFQASPSAWSAAGGVLACLPELPRAARLGWVDRSGRVEEMAGMPIGGWGYLRVSPDGTRLALNRSTEEGTTSVGVDLWLIEPARSLASRLTFDPGIAASPVWSPEGRRILYASNRAGRYELYLRSADGAGEPEFVARASGLIIIPNDWSPDGRSVVYEVDDARTSMDVWLLSMDGRRDAKPLLNSPFTEQGARISPDGRWLAYTSNESGRPEVYVQAFPSLGGKVQASLNGGEDARWSHDGRELFYRGLDGSLMAAKVQASPTLRFEAATRLFKLGEADAGYDNAPDGRRFAFVLLGDRSRSAPTVIVNWTGLLKGK